MKSNKLITRKALTQLMLAMVASGKTHRSDFESMQPNDIVLLAANLLDPSLCKSIQVTATEAEIPQSVVDHTETEVASQFIWPTATMEKVYRYLELTVMDRDDGATELGPYSSYDTCELLCTFFEECDYWYIRESLYEKYGAQSEQYSETDLLELMATEDALPIDLTDLFTNYVFFTDDFCSDVIDRIEAEIKDRSQTDLVEALAKRLYLDSSYTADKKTLESHGLKASALKNMPQRKTKQLAWDLDCCVYRQQFIELAYMELGIQRT